MAESGMNEIASAASWLWASRFSNDKTALFNGSAWYVWSYANNQL